MNEQYREFLSRKVPKAKAIGFNPASISDHLFDFQKAVTEFSVQQGRAGLYLDTGLGKTRCEIEWAMQCVRHERNAKALILTPIAVARQFEREANAIGYEAKVIRDQSEAVSGINICNYDRIDKLDPGEFSIIALDESSILKGFNGKTSQSLISSFDQHRFRLCASATPAPNDHMELGQQSAFLGVMPANEMLMRWFINNTEEASQSWRLKGHATEDFWDWMASWSRMAQSPDDLGFDGSRYVLPPLNVIRHKAQANIKPIEGSLFSQDVSATNMFAVKRQTADARAAIVAGLVNDGQVWTVWCDTDAEADILKQMIPDAIEVRGSMQIERKEENLDAFATGKARVIITKPSIAGYGCNWQHCSNVAFVGRSFSYELWYQAVRRSWRFGQKNPVNVHLVVAEGEDQIGRVIDRKATDHATMKTAMAKAMRRAMSKSPVERVDYVPNFEGKVPSWLTSSVA